ncbi:PorP/SprF family type IX secretion system membrane protein [Paraflavisolibacter sp. H34]|uniref:PorP/SprF family type IX secretion system membrane protein n=1 Tax=Huijunlia imazamoxiresistens TaxID=3127457 RepID=UPI003015E4E6
MRKIAFLLMLCFGAIAASAQDPNFSQFFASPLTLNPALTGKFNGALRVAGNYRNQWPTINNAFTTYTLSVDGNILKNAIPEIDQFGIGLLGFSDRSGGGVLQYNYLGASTAYQKGLDENGYHQLGLGFQGTYVSKRLNTQSLKMEDQLRADGFTGLSQEAFNNSRLTLSYFDLSTGILYNGTTNGSNNIYAGVSMYHLNRHKEKFTDTGNFYLPARVTFQGGGMVPVNGGLDQLHFSANYSRQANATNTVFGGAYMLNLNGDENSPTNLYLGSWYRLGDAVIPYIGLEFGEFHVGATYDVNISKLKPASNLRGGAEFSLIYIKRHQDPNARKLNCPKF